METVWTTTVAELLPHEGYKPNDGSFASVSPITDGEHVFGSFGSRGLYCLDLTGRVPDQGEVIASSSRTTRFSSSVSGVGGRALKTPARD